MNSIHHATYLQHIQKHLPDLNPDYLSSINQIIENTNWDDPELSSDWNNIAVIALIEAEKYTNDLITRSMYLDMAFEALNNGLSIDNHPLCASHLALIYNLIGANNQAIEIAFNTLINQIQAACTQSPEVNNYLIYIPKNYQQIADPDRQSIQQILQSRDSYEQAIFLLGKIISNSQMAFYTPFSRRFLNIVDQIINNSVELKLKLGISNLMSRQVEGILYLQKARKLAPNHAPALQALYLAYRDLEQQEIAEYWRNISKELYQLNPDALEWFWTQLPVNSSFTYIPFEQQLIIAVEPSLKSIATSVLIAEQDWFEHEMEFWRNHIQPGMTIIDVGANVGVYTFSAALKVGKKGKVLAVEPYSVCVRCLQETCRINQLSSVKICAGAASNNESSIKLLLHSANELNQVITGEAAENLAPGSFEEVPCFTLDSLIKQEQITNVDFLKIDAEGHEMAVLTGSQQIINQFSPIILYENIAGSQGSNIEVAQYLINLDYELFYYQPFLQKLIPVNLEEDAQTQLNFIAVPPEKTTMFNVD
ncbi:MAG TPA: FkbM family methyltransferase [Nostocaceae cyanobacterium]|nr:FkbM family methyltransferase [Nostocaceae cyanobacterium]